MAIDILCNLVIFNVAFFVSSMLTDGVILQLLLLICVHLLVLICYLNFRYGYWKRKRQ